MKILLQGIFCLLSFYCYAQEPVDRDYDFSNVRFDSLDLRTIGAQFDSVWFASGADSLVQLAAHVKRTSNISTYGAVDFGYEVFTASLLQLNSELAALGFANISERFGGVIWGFSAKSPRWLVALSSASARTTNPPMMNTTSKYQARISTLRWVMTLSTIRGFSFIHRQR